MIGYFINILLWFVLYRYIQTLLTVLFAKVSASIYSPFDPLLYGNRAQSYLKLKKLR